MAHRPMAVTWLNLEHVLERNKRWSALVMHVLPLLSATCFTSVREPAAARATGDRVRLHPVAGADVEPVHDRPGRPAHPRRTRRGRPGARAAVRVRPGDRGGAGRPGGGGPGGDRDHVVLGGTAAGRPAAGAPV